VPLFRSMFPPECERTWPDVLSEKLVCRFWARNGLTAKTIEHYRQHLGRFFAYCKERGLAPQTQLTADRLVAFFRWHVRRTSRPSSNPKDHYQNLSSPIRAYAWALSATGHQVPVWKAPLVKPEPPAIVAGYVAHGREQKGLAVGTLQRDTETLTDFVAFLRRRGRHWKQVGLHDIDQYLAKQSGRLAPATIGRMACAIRSWLRFLHATGRIPHDIALLVVSPVRKPLEQPPRALPWKDIRKMVRAIDLTTSIGLRDRAQILLMSSYGLGAAEVIQLRLEDVDWRGRRLNIIRRKTKVPICLPLSADVARALADYIRRGRPGPTQSRYIFLSNQMPYLPFGQTGFLRHRVRVLAQRAGIEARILGTHLFRHSHATRHVLLGTPMKILGDILGHSRPDTTSIYARAAVQRLRRLALPLPV
jgi:integrase/recombinase XerD